MSETPTYYVRLARSVEGPLSRSDLLERLRLNLLSTYHEVSIDQKHWRALDPIDLEPEDSATALPDLMDPAAENNEADAAWLATLDKLVEPQSTAEAINVPLPAASPAALLRGGWLSRSTTLSSGMLLMVACNLAIPRSDGTRSGWWQAGDALGWTLGVWAFIGVFVLLAAALPQPRQRGRCLTGLAALGWLVGLLLIGGDAALCATASVWWFVVPALAWSTAYAVRKLTGPQGLPTPDPRRRIRLTCVVVSACLAWFLSSLFTLTNAGLPDWWLAVLILGLSPAACFLRKAIQPEPAHQYLAELVSAAILAVGMLTATVILGIHQGFVAEKPHDLSQLVVTSVGFIALIGCGVAAGLEYKPDA